MNIDRNKLTPMMKQYFEVKDRYPDCIVRDLFVSYDDEPVQTTVYGLKPGLYDVLIKRIKHNQEDYTNLVSRLQYDLSNTFPKKGTYNKK